MKCLKNEKTYGVLFAGDYMREKVSTMGDTRKAFDESRVCSVITERFATALLFGSDQFDVVWEKNISRYKDEGRKSSGVIYAMTNPRYL
jgi:hypothetical protein